MSASSTPRTAISRRSLLAGLAMGITAAAAAGLQPRAAPGRVGRAGLGGMIPARIGPWQLVGADGVIVARADETIDGPADGYENVLARAYAAAGLPTVMLLMAYGSAQGGGLQLHRPETCYPGQGFTLSDHRDTTIRFAGADPIGARRFTATRDDRVERLVYWTRIGDRFPLDSAGEYVAILRSALSRTVADGLLVRLSTLSSDVALADTSLDAFAKALVAETTPAGRRMIVGQSADRERA